MSKPVSFFCVIAVTISTAFAADPPPPNKKEIRDQMKLEERMKEEKKDDEHAARSNAGRVRVARFDSVFRPPRNTDIDVFQTNEVVTKAYKAVALLTYEAKFDEEVDAVSGFVAKARELGADGVVLKGYDSKEDRRLFRANAIIYQ